MWRSRGLLTSIFLLVLLPAISFAQEWPSKPVKFVSPYPPGGSVDPLARLFAAKLTDALKQQFIVENRTGASGIIGTDYVAKSAPDGYTWCFIFDTHSVHQALNPKIPFDPVKDFAPVMLVGYAPMAITTSSDKKPYKTFADVVAAAKAKPDTLTIGNVGNGSLGHLASIMVNQAAGIRLVPVPYKGGGPLSTDVLGGQIDFAMASTAAQAQYVRSGKMRALALTGDRRSHTMPDVPTLKELGIDVVANAWWGILAPAGTPKPIVDKMVSELRKVIGQSDVQTMLRETLGMEVIALGPEATQKWINDAIARWGKVVRDNGIKSE